MEQKEIESYLNQVLHRCRDGCLPAFGGGSDMDFL